MANHDGIELWSSEGATPILHGVDVAVAFPDGNGGVIYQERATIEQISRGESTPIMRLVAPGAEPEMLASAPTAVSLIDVSHGPDKLIVAYSERLPPFDGCGEKTPEECADHSSHDLVFLDLADRSQRRYSYWRAWEYISFHFDLGDQLVATRSSDYEGTTPPCVGVFTVDEIVASSGEQSVCPDQPEACPELDDAGFCRWQLAPTAMSSDDTSLAYLWWDGSSTLTAFELVTRDTATRTQISRSTIVTDGRFYPHSMDLADDGWVLVRGCVAGTSECVPAIVTISPDGTVTQPFTVPFATIWATT